MKRQRTRLQVFEELRAFTRSTTYAAWTQALASTATSTSTAVLDGSKSEPISPITSSPSSFLLPIFPSPTKYHFRSQDRRRASFPKSSSHSNLNLNVNINMMGLSMQQVNNIAVSESRQAVIPKHLRFSLEVQELVFLQSSPPFRISRAKPTRAHSDPAIQTSSSSSFIAPSHSSASSSPSNVTAAIQAASLSSSPSSTNLLQQQHQGNLISTATASSSSFENTTTTFIKIRAQDFRGLGIDEDDIPECKYNDDYLDEYLFEDCRESGEDEDDEEYEEGDDECEPYCESRTRLSSKDGVVARRIQREDRHRHPSMLWQVYTAVTGVKELIAWYGSMVYHSSSL
ncbi:hypothetical protein BGZ83_002561 [Gryganskiella cystojenkinii]|nr:hypothetical protein BGZ83_002561 [Gryganskiella cystojenkinii]